ncbi:hypothetical protein HN748_05300 [Candidatus Peregrinibacteria bacterium]|nr:hypothetical protein [Candidatus Peregrinibacteria bacterium]MBT7484676.1 hypothetical protein [Candidatus Peregrinibacteria bacterium]MBT7703625.1 hypothetical protein [Candidatus Peregrinibacteria bacterium]
MDRDSLKERTDTPEVDTSNHPHVLKVGEINDASLSETLESMRVAISYLLKLHGHVLVIQSTIIRGDRAPLSHDELKEMASLENQAKKIATFLVKMFAGSDDKLEEWKLQRFLEMILGDSKLQAESDLIAVIDGIRRVGKRNGTPLSFDRSALGNLARIRNRFAQLSPDGDDRFTVANLGREAFRHLKKGVLPVGNFAQSLMPSTSNLPGDFTPSAKALARFLRAAGLVSPDGEWLKEDPTAPEDIR